MTEIASYVFREENLEFSVHGSQKKFALIQLKLELLLNALKNENSRYLEKYNNVEKIKEEFDLPVYYKHFFKTPLTVNNCSESMIIPTITNIDDNAALQVLGDLMTFTYLIPSIREKGGAYGAGCKVSENGIFTFHSYRDPKIDSTYDNFEKALDSVVSKEFTEGQLREAKLLTFQKLDKVIDPSLKGLYAFSRGYTDEQRLKIRLRCKLAILNKHPSIITIINIYNNFFTFFTGLDLTREDLVAVAEKYLIKAIEGGKTSRVVFGSQNADFNGLETQGWRVQNPIDFLSYSYFDQWNQEVK